MTRLKLFISLLSLFLLGVSFSPGQVTLVQESFETDGEGTRYTSNSGDDPFLSDIWDRTTSLPHPYHSTTIGTGTLDGSYYWAAEDVQSLLGFSTKAFVQLNPINVFNSTGLEVQIALGLSRFNQVRWENDDYLVVEYNLDGTGWDTLALYRGDNASPGIGGLTRLDTDGTLSTFGPFGAQMPGTFTDFTYAIPSTGASLQVRVSTNVNGSEEFGFDNIRVRANNFPTTPSLGSGLVCDPANNVIVGNDTINLAGTHYDAGADETYFFYCITSGSQPSISHLTFTCGGCDLNDLPFCANTSACGADLFSGSGIVDNGTWAFDGSGGAIISSGSGSPSQGCDNGAIQGQGGYCGLKFDQGFNDGEARMYYFTLDGNWGVGTISLISKGGPGFDFMTIPGPDCGTNNKLQVCCPSTIGGTFSSLLNIPSAASDVASFSAIDAMANIDNPCSIPLTVSHTDTVSGTGCGGDTLMVKRTYTISGGLFMDICEQYFKVLPSDNDTTNVAATTCDPGQVGVVQQTFTNQAGCDSVVITTTTLLPNDTTNVAATTCDPGQVGVIQQTFTNQFGCDSIVLTTTTLLPNDTTNVAATTCDPGQVGVTVNTLTNQFGCDSVLITTTTLLPNDTTNVAATTCDPGQVGVTVNTLTNQFGCDSVLITTTTLLPNDTTNVAATTCDPGQVGVTVNTLTNQFGCDSVLITTTTLLPNDTTNVAATTCDPGQVGVTVNTLTNQFGCDSVLITTTTLLPNDTTNVAATTCDPGQVGVTVNTLTNQFGCDSVLITTTTLLPNDTTNVAATTCDPGQVGVTVNTLTNQFGCDSVLITTTTLLPNDTTNVAATTCDPGQVGVMQQTFTNQFGCDSIVLTTTTLLPNDTTNVAATTCDPGQVGVNIQVFTNQFGCDSTVITSTTLLPSDTTNIAETTCDPAQLGVVQQTFTNQFGCDSVVITTTSLAPSPDAPTVVNEPVLCEGTTIDPSNSAHLLEVDGCGSSSSSSSSCAYDAYGFDFSTFNIVGIDVLTGTPTPIVPVSNFLNFPGSGEVIDGALYATDIAGSSAGFIQGFDLTTGAFMSYDLSSCTSGSGGGAITGIERDPTSGILYAGVCLGASIQLYELTLVPNSDPSNPLAASISCAPAGNPVNVPANLTFCTLDLVIAPTGQGYLVALDNSVTGLFLVPFDPGTGTVNGAVVPVSGITLSALENFDFACPVGASGLYGYVLSSTQNSGAYVYLDPATGVVTTIQPLSPGQYVFGFALCDAPAGETTWWDQPTGGSQQGTGATLDPTGTTAEEGSFDATTPGTYTYYAQCELDACISSRTPVTITIETGPDAGLDNVTSECEGTLVDLTALVSVPGGSFEDPGATGGLSGTDFNTSGLPEGDYEIWYIMSSTNSCPNDTALITLTVEPGTEEICVINTYDSSNPDDHVFVFFDFPKASGGSYLAARFVWDSAPGEFAVNGDGTATITGKVKLKQDPNVKFDVYFLLENKMDWTTWSSLGRIAALKPATQAVGSLEHVNWDYYEMSSTSNFTGCAGSTYDGDVISMTHRPSDLSMGFQIGFAANEKDNDKGMSGWFDWSFTTGGVTYSDWAT